MTLQELKDQRLSVYRRMEKRLADAKLNSDGRLSPEERTAHSSDEAEFDRLDKDIKEWEADQSLTKGLSSRMPSTPAHSRKTDPDPVGGPRFGSQKLAAEDDPNKGFKTHREFLSTIISASMNGQLDERLHLCRARVSSLTAGSDEAGTYSDPVGGYLIPKGFSPNLLSLAAESDPVAALTTKIPMETPTLDIPARVDKNHSNSVSGGLRVYRRAETDTSNSSRMEFEQVGMRATSLFGVSYATEELLARSPMSFVALLESGFSDEFAAKLMDERLNGSGVSMFEGVMNSPALISIAKETGQAADTIVKENIDKMRSRCWRYGQAVWLYNHDCLPQLRSLVQAVGTGGAPVPYFQTDANGNSTLDGRPAFATEFTRTLGDQGDLVLGVWSQYLEGVLSDMEMAESIHVRFLNHERTFKFWVENDGRCWWRSALTPKRSTATLSPFVVLDAR